MRGRYLILRDMLTQKARLMFVVIILEDVPADVATSWPNYVILHIKYITCSADIDYTPDDGRRRTRKGPRQNGASDDAMTRWLRNKKHDKHVLYKAAHLIFVVVVLEDVPADMARPWYKLISVRFPRQLSGACVHNRTACVFAVLLFYPHVVQQQVVVIDGHQEAALVLQNQKYRALSADSVDNSTL